MLQIINCLAYEESLLRVLEDKLSQLRSSAQLVPKLATVLVGEDSASQVYVKNKTLKAKKLGINVENYTLPANTSQEHLLKLLGSLNRNPDISGVLLQLPLPAPLAPHTQTFLNTLDPMKDVDGLSSYNLGLLTSGQSPLMLPCTPLGVMYILQQQVPDLTGKKVVVVGRSTLVGLPVSLLILARNATVTICHSRTENLVQECCMADVLVVAVGQAGLVKADCIKPRAVVIDVGINRVKNSGQEGGICGDVCLTSLQQCDVKLTPVPKGVGRLTVACLLHNTYRACRLQHGLPDNTYESIFGL